MISIKIPGLWEKKLLTWLGCYWSTVNSKSMFFYDLTFQQWICNLYWLIQKVMWAMMMFWLGNTFCILCLLWNMMMSSNGNIFHVTGPLCGEFTSDRWIPLTKASDMELLMFSLICARINGWGNIREAGDLRCHHAHYDVIVMEFYWICVTKVQWHRAWMFSLLLTSMSSRTISRVTSDLILTDFAYISQCYLAGTGAFI